MPKKEYLQVELAGSCQNPTDSLTFNSLRIYTVLTTFFPASGHGHELELHAIGFVRTYRRFVCLCFFLGHISQVEFASFPLAHLYMLRIEFEGTLHHTYNCGLIQSKHIYKLASGVPPRSFSHNVDERSSMVVEGLSVTTILFRNRHGAPLSGTKLALQVGHLLERRST